MKFFNQGLNVLKLVLLVLAISCVLSVAKAASPEFWLVSTQEDFLLGRAENVSVDAIGQIQLAPHIETVFETTAPFLWTAAYREGLLWVGSGNDGKLYAIDDSDSVAEAFDAEELNIHAIAPIDNTTAYIGTSPDGAVYQVSSQGIPPRLVADLEERYIWAVVIDPRSGDLYVGTGEPGRIYRILPDGSTLLHYETESTHVLTMALDKTGNLLAGTGSPGQVLRIDDSGQGFTLLNSSFAEVRSLRVTSDGSAYAVAVSQTSSRGSTSNSPSTPSGSGAPTVTVSSTITSVASSRAPSNSLATSNQSARNSPADGAVYRIQEDGVWDVIWQSTADTPYDIAVTVDETGDHSILIGTGGRGKIYRVSDEPPNIVLLSQVASKQITKFATTPSGEHFFVTANPGKVHRLSTESSQTGTYISEARDANTVANWGTVRWRASEPDGTTLRLFTRSGNTENPNSTWSSWSEPYLNSAGSQISSPKARYLQWKAELAGNESTPVLRAVTTAYLSTNVRPKVDELTVHPAGVVFQQPFSGTDPPIAGLGVESEARLTSNDPSKESPQPSLGRSVYHKGLQSFVWSASDDNQDDLEFDVLYRAESANDWATLAKMTRQSIFTWDTTSTPDGTYVVRVVASDSPSNAPGAELSGIRDSAPFDIDNSPPRISLQTTQELGDQTVVSFTVEDDQSPIQQVEYSTNTDQWEIVYPVDGIPDSQMERFEISINNDYSIGIVLRATDAMANTTTASGQ